MIEFIGTIGLGFLFGAFTTFAFMAWEERREEAAQFEIDASAAMAHAKMRQAMGTENQEKEKGNGR